MNILLIILILIFIYVISSLIIYKRAIKNLNRELGYIYNNGLSNRRLSGSTRKKDLKELEEIMNSILADKQKVSLEYSKREKEIKEMIASISHDLRTPLTSIKGYTDLLIKSTKKEEEKEKLEIIKNRSEVMSELISSFYELSKLELKEYDVELSYIDINKLLLEVLASYYDKFKERNLEPILNFSSRELLILGDERAVNRIFSNIINNSFKYAKSRFELKLYEDRKYLIMEFINDVENLNKEDIGKIFDKFYIMDTSRQSEGTGLGLFITRELLNKMGHEIEVELLNEDIIIRIKWNK